MNRIWERFIDLLTMAGAVLLQAPNKRFDMIVGSEKDKFEGIVGSTAIVTETVTMNSGVVRYSGATWRARLSENSDSGSVIVGAEVVIESSEGNVLVVV